MEPTAIAEIIQIVFNLIQAVFGVESEIAQGIIAFIGAATVIIGAASTIVAALRKIAKVTPNTTDDLYVNKVAVFLAKVSAVFDRLALNPDKTAARKPKRE